MIKIKPLSVNECWQGRRFKTKTYLRYEDELWLLLPKMDIDKTKRIKLEIQFGFSNKASDIDNCIKPFLDILQKKYGFNDKMIYKLSVEKYVVKKGEGFIDFYLDYL